MIAARAMAWRMLLVANRCSTFVQQANRAERRQLRSAAALGGTDQAAAAPPPRVGRPSKTAAKQEAKQYQDIARQLSRLTDKQLVRLMPLVGEEVVDAVRLAARISHRNQGRQRQESLVAKLLRETVQDTEVSQLQAAIESVKTGQGVIANPKVEQQVQLWLQALLAGDGVGATQVFALAQSSGQDLQMVRQLLRQAQQSEAPPAPAAAAAAAPTGSNDGAQEAAAVVSSTAAARPTPKALKARKQLRGLLQPLAEAQLSEEEESDQ